MERVLQCLRLLFSQVKLSFKILRGIKMTPSSVTCMIFYYNPIIYVDGFSFFCLFLLHFQDCVSNLLMTKSK